MTTVGARCLAAAAIVLIGLAIVLPAPVQAAGDPAYPLPFAPPSTEGEAGGGPAYGAPSLPQPPELERFLSELSPAGDAGTLPVRVTASDDLQPVAGEDRNGEAAGSKPLTPGRDAGTLPNTLTPEEIRGVREVLTISRATAGQVGLITLVVRGLGILLAGGAWILLLVVVRRVFDRWFDAHIYDSGWLSMIVVVVLLYCTMRIIVAVVS